MLTPAVHSKTDIFQNTTETVNLSSLYSVIKI